MLLLLFKNLFLFFLRGASSEGRAGRQPSRHSVLVGRSKPQRNANFSRAEAIFSSLRARRTSKTVAKRQFLTWSEQPSRHFVLVGRSKLWRNATLSVRLNAKSESRTSKTVAKRKFAPSTGNPFVTSCLLDVLTVVRRWFLYAASCRGRRSLVSCIFAFVAVTKRAFRNF